ncbi:MULTISPECIES: hypothetical protein [unclassified Tolypothrix]|uniref:hypothetical protein n=1 Tax=unclassified Tolypothrix TaxID=2649714 RepID=UPI000AFDCA23|nr:MULTISPECIES: hypothetical protein [unclassified Tolypothrix]MBE9085459.1 hypothetical protein [Tolypothrix sp. LEGE 11397]UYD24952.1 hypothetical protein HGR01_26605 [Tolypothrix sp. PCC 7712]UYD32813.1 hypothetical protein HG267_28030 [Tolypothrix sp. PCC 7601]BAY90824.1 hypothetical protein NIES3275_28410 [Microchaete diplosiphon NIES-3275]
MSQNLITRSRREPAIAIALLDETVYAMIDHRRLSGTIASHLGLQMQGDLTENDSPTAKYSSVKETYVLSRKRM